MSRLLQKPLDTAYYFYKSFQNATSLGLIITWFSLSIRLEQRGNRSETRPILTHLGWFLSSFVRLRLTHSSLTSPSARERLRRRTERGSREAGTGGEGWWGSVTRSFYLSLWSPLSPLYPRLFLGSSTPYVAEGPEGRGYEVRRWQRNRRGE